ncbi:DUF6445 family protein [Rheinheimera sp.]|uniref:DUF6445 family protein n=1 Tax=Rheinheimera sp. TaxID=1869214 RepID=UPI0027BA8402|nr:DUF6445 family protein [Rheinheimera sp.]
MQQSFWQQTSTDAAARPAAVESPLAERALVEAPLAEPPLVEPGVRINPRLKPELVLLGQQQTPLIVIDDLVENLPQLLAYAAVQNFQQDRDSYYPGVRALLPRTYVKAVLDALYPLLYQQYQLAANLRLTPKDIYFSLINQKPETLLPLQRLPHFDTPSNYYFALLHYLAPEPHGGTGFFRHLPTGYERIDAANQQHYFASAQQYLDKQGVPAAAYCDGTDGHYQLYQAVPYRQNRLVIYPGNLLHSSLVKPELDISSDASSGRLTANIFIEFVPRPAKFAAK